MWVKLDDRFYMHPKVLATSLEGIGLFAVGLSYAGAYETDGKLSHSLVSLIARDRLDVVTELVKNGLWIANGNGYEIHDFLKYNPSKAKRIKERKAWAKRQRDWRVSHVKSHGVTTGRDGTGPKESSSSVLLLPDPKGKVRKGLIPEDLVLSDKMRAFAMRVPGYEAEYEFGRFKDWHRFKETLGTRWDAAWRNWVRKSVEISEENEQRRGRR